MNKAILFLVVLAACGGNPDAAINEKAAPNEHVSVVGTDAGVETAVDYLDGRDGKDGEPGPQGVPGEIGPQGPQGLPGERGVAGPQGPVGLTGATGPQGIPGVPGPQGSAGAQGLPGIKGADGATGAKGDSGPQGPQGVAGTPGVVGSQGLQGVAGSVGPTGADGAGGYWIDSTGARAPIVNSSIGWTYNSLYVDPQGFMYRVHPMTGRLESATVTHVPLVRYFENSSCTGRSWYRIQEFETIIPMLTFPMEGTLNPGTYAFSRDVKIAYSTFSKAVGFPAQAGSRLVAVPGSVPQCAPGNFPWPTLVEYSGGAGSVPVYYYYIAAEHIIPAPNPSTVVKTTVPPYRFVPNL